MQDRGGKTQTRCGIICVLLATRETETGGPLELMSSARTQTTYLGPSENPQVQSYTSQCSGITKMAQPYTEDTQQCHVQQDVGGAVWVVQEAETNS